MTDQTKQKRLKTVRSYLDQEVQRISAISSPPGKAMQANKLAKRLLNFEYQAALRSRSLFFQPKEAIWRTLSEGSLVREFMTKPRIREQNMEVRALYRPVIDQMQKIADNYLADHPHEPVVDHTDVDPATLHLSATPVVN